MILSVALCTFNGEKYIAEQLESILQQTIAVDEIVVCDDGSTDATWEILERYKNHYPAVFRIFKNEKTLKVTKNFEKAINLCTKDIIFLCDQDDLWLPDKTQKIVEFFENNPDKSAVCHDLQLMKEGKILEYTNWYTLNFSPIELEEMSFSERLLFRGNVITGAGFAFRNFRTEIELDTLSTKFLHDRQLGLFFALENKLGAISESLSVYRLHENQQVGTNLKIREAKMEEFQKFRKSNPRLKINFYNSAMEYWAQNLKFVSQERVNTLILSKLAEQKKKYFNSLPLFKRKLTQIIWWVNKRYYTQLKELL